MFKWLTHSRDKTGDFGYRAFLHIPIGLLIGIPLLGLPLLLVFIRYEENEDIHTKDEAWKDYFGAIIGAVISTLVITGLLIYFAVK